MFSEKIDIPIMLAKITLKKSKGITIVDLPTLRPSIVKNWANKPNIVAIIINNIDGQLGYFAISRYGIIKNKQLKNENQNCMWRLFSM